MVGRKDNDQAGDDSLSPGIVHNKHPPKDSHFADTVGQIYRNHYSFTFFFVWKAFLYYFTSCWVVKVVVNLEVIVESLKMHKLGSFS